MLVDESFAVSNRVRRRTPAPEQLLVNTCQCIHLIDDCCLHTPLHHTGAVHSAHWLTCGRRPHNSSSSLFPTCTAPVESWGRSSTTSHSRRSPRCWGRSTNQRAASRSPPCTPTSPHAHLPAHARAMLQSRASRAPTGSSTSSRSVLQKSCVAAPMPNSHPAATPCRRLVVAIRVTATPCRLGWGRRGGLHLLQTRLQLETPGIRPSPLQHLLPKALTRYAEVTTTCDGMTN